MTKRITLAAGALFCAQVFTAQATELKDLPAGTKWVLNLDMKAAQASPILNYMVNAIAPAKRQAAQAKIAAVKALFGVDLIKDIDSLVIAGNGNAQDGGVAYIYARLDSERLSTILAINSTFSSTDYSGFKLLSWLDDNDKKQKFGTFVKPGLTVISDKKECLLEALDVLAGKKACLAADSAFKQALSDAGSVLTVMATDVPSIVGEQPKAQALRQAQSLCLHVNASQPDVLSAALSVTATSSETAVQIRQALMGIQALAMLRASEAPEQATLASLAKITVEGTTVGMSLDLPKKVIEDTIRQHEAREAAKAAPAAPAPAP